MEWENHWSRKSARLWAVLALLATFAAAWLAVNVSKDEPSTKVGSALDREAKGCDEEVSFAQSSDAQVPDKLVAAAPSVAPQPPRERHSENVGASQPVAESAAVVLSDEQMQRIGEIRRLMDAADYITALPLLTDLIAEFAGAEVPDRLAMLLGECLFQAGHPEPALDTFLQVAHATDDPSIFRASIVAAFNIAERSNSQPQLLSRYTDELDNAGVRDLEVLALLYELTGDVDAELDTRRVLMEESYNERNLLRLVDIYERSNKLHAASLILESIANNAATEHPWLFLRRAGELMIRAEDEHAAISYFKQAVQLPDVPPFQALQIGAMLSELGEHEVALRAFDDALEATERDELRDQLLLEICRTNALLGRNMNWTLQTLADLENSTVSYVARDSVELLNSIHGRN